MHFFSKEAFDFKSQIRSFNKLQNLNFCALMVALFIVVSFFDISITQTIEIRLGFIIIAIAGLLGGPVMGMSVGALGDIVKMIVTGGKGSSFFFGFTISYAILGLAFGLIFYKSRITISRAVAAGICEFLVSIFLNTYNLSILFGTSFEALFVSRLLKSSVMLFINIALLYIVLKAIAQAFKHAHVVIE